MEVIDEQNIKPTEPSREELFVADYLRDAGISFKSEVELHDLLDDPTKTHRRVDFYLKNLDVYVEYFGLYNSTKERRQEYEEKKRVYFKNRMPSIFLYPHELGIIDYAFHTKMIRLLRHKSIGNRKHLIRYKLNRLWRYGDLGNLIGAGLFFFLFVLFVNMEGFGSVVDDAQNELFAGFALFFCIWMIYIPLRDVYRYLVLER